MKIALKSVSLAILWGIFMPILAKASEQTVEKRVFIIVPQSYSEVINVAVGDMVQLNTKRIPLDPQTLGHQYAVSYDSEYVRLIASSPIDVAGPMGREVYVIPHKPGISVLKITLQDEKKKAIDENIFTLKIH